MYLNYCVSKPISNEPKKQDTIYGGIEIPRSRYYAESGFTKIKNTILELHPGYQLVGYAMVRKNHWNGRNKDEKTNHYSTRPTNGSSHLSC